MNEDDRRILLKRRALFLSAAALATACGGESAAAGAKDPSAVNVAAPAASGQPAETTAAPKRNPEVDLPAPPELVVPADASDAARNMYTHLKKQVTRVQIEVAAIARSMLTCTPEDCQSDAAVEQLARAYATTLFLIGELSPHCSGSSEHGRLYQEAVEGQQAFFEAKLELYHKGLLKQMRSLSDFPDRFQAAVTRANAAQPRVCLDCGDW